MAISGMEYDTSTSPIAWSPCGQFVASLREGVEVRDPLTFELLSTFQPTEHKCLLGSLAYSPDAGIVVWDIQSGGVVREIHYPKLSLIQWWVEQLVWSLDGGLICTVVQGKADHHTVCRYDVTSGMTLSPVILQSEGGQYLWAHNESFLAIVIGMGSEGHTLNIFKVGDTLTKIGSLPTQLQPYKWQIKSFSPTTHCVSLLGCNRLLILDIEKPGGLLDERGAFQTHTFSSDGCHFAACYKGYIHIWKLDSNHYIQWRKFPARNMECSQLLLSPTSPLILGSFTEALKLWYWGGPSIAPRTHGQQLSITSPSGGYIMTANYGESSITITNTISNVPSQYIDTGIEISGLALIGNVLLVVDLKVAMAWQLTEEGLVDSILGKRRANHGNTIWKDQARIIGSSRDAPYIYEKWNYGDNQTSQEWYPFWFIIQGWHQLCNHFINGTSCKDDQKLSKITVNEGG